MQRKTWRPNSKPKQISRIARTAGQAWVATDPEQHSATSLGTPRISSISTRNMLGKTRHFKPAEYAVVCNICGKNPLHCVHPRVRVSPFACRFSAVGLELQQAPVDWKLPFKSLVKRPDSRLSEECSGFCSRTGLDDVQVPSTS